MKADAANFVQLLGERRQFEIPIYQRTYSWTISDCQQLWDDILRVAKKEEIPSHFVGSIVYVQSGIYTTVGVPRLLVIDGQQRLTTLSLLLAALGVTIEEQGVVLTIDEDQQLDREKLRNYYLINPQEEGNRRYKIVLTRTDKDTFANIIEGIDAPKDYSRRVVENFNFFLRMIRRNSVSLDTLFYGISKLVIVEVSLDRSQDNPQLIFESLNSTGVDLSQSDLIRNFILMGQEPNKQKTLYNQYWYPIETRFGQEDYAKQFDFFMRDYLTLKYDGKIPTLRDVYKTFKEFTQTSKLTIDEIVADIYEHAMMYVRFLYPEYEEDPEIREILDDILTLKMQVAYPFLLEVFFDYQKGYLTRDEVVEILKIVESYVFRRAIVGIPTNSMNKTFATLTRSINKKRYLESVKAAFLLLDSYRRYPTDEEFQSEFIQKDVYNFRSRSYLLRKLENVQRKEPVNIDEWTIEHVMPQNENLSQEWQDMLGPDWEAVQTRYLHTIGNLTLTGYNPELSDRPFLKKRDMEGGFRDSPIRLNKQLRDLSAWNENSIVARAWNLTEVARQIWSYTELPYEILDAYKRSNGDEPEEYGFDHFEYLEGSTLELFELIRRRIMNLDPSVREEPKKLYIAYKTTTNFVDIVPQRSRLRLSLNMRFAEVNDPEGWCVDVTDKGRWGNGDVEVGFDSPDQIEYIMFLINQSFNLHDDDL